MNDSEQNSQPNCNSSDRIGSNNIVNEIIPINLNNNQNIDIGNSEKDRNSNNSKIIRSVFNNNNNIQKNEDKTDILIELQKSLIEKIEKIWKSQDEHNKNMKEMLKIMQNQGEELKQIRQDHLNELKKIRQDHLNELKQIRQDQLNELKKIRQVQLNELKQIRQVQLNELKQIRNGQLNELENQKLLINEITKMGKTQGEILNKLSTDEEKRKIQIKKKTMTNEKNQEKKRK